MRYEEIEHTADVGIRVYGDSLEELFAGAAAGMFSLITDIRRVRPVGEARVQVAADDLGALLVKWLSELLFLHETQRLLLSVFEVRVDGLALDATARGEAIDKSRHELRLNIKAVTYHAMRIDPEAGTAQIIFDI